MEPETVRFSSILGTLLYFLAHFLLLTGWIVILTGNAFLGMPLAVLGIIWAVSGLIAMLVYLRFHVQSVLRNRRFERRGIPWSAWVVKYNSALIFGPLMLCVGVADLIRSSREY